MTDIAFTATKAEYDIIHKIVLRAERMLHEMRLEVDFDRQSMRMDIEACHCNGMPLNLADLLDANDGDFGHDVFGIRKYIDRNTGKMMRCFVPRYALPQNYKAV